jgi:hypothetical protein
VYAPAKAFGRTCATCTESDDRDVLHGSRDLKILCSTRVIKRLMVREGVRRSVVRQHAATGVTAAACKRGNS